MVEGSFKNIDESALTEGTLNWKGGNPSGGTSKNCALLYKYEAWDWECSGDRHYICKSGATACLPRK